MFRPIVKAFVTIISVFITGLLCSAIINSLTVNNEVQWRSCYKKNEFWIMLIYCGLLILYTFYATKDEIVLRRRFDDEYFIQLYRQDQIGLIVAQQNEALQKGDFDKFDSFHQVLKKIRREGK
jgi:hypothetical protein